MTINKDTPVHRIWAAYPQLIHRLVKRDHRYAYLENLVISQNFTS